MFYLLFSCVCVTCVSGDGGDEDDDDDEWEDTDEEGDFDSDGGLSGDEDLDDGGPREFLFMDEETKSRFTEYSLTSSVMRRNEQLTLLDDRFEKVNAPPRLGQRPKSPISVNLLRMTSRRNFLDCFLKAKQNSPFV